MSDSDHIVQRLIETTGIHAFVFICEAADKYLPIVNSLEMALANGHRAKATDFEPEIGQKVDETRKTLKREDRIVWALRYYKKALALELLWLAKNDPQFVQEKFGSPPAPEQPGLEKQIRKLADVDLSPFETPGADTDFPPYVGYATIDAINQRLGHYLDLADSLGENDKDNIIHRLIFQHQSFGQILSLFRRGQILLHKKHAASLVIKQARGVTANGEQYDMRDDEGPIQTWVTFPNGWRWLNLLRNCSEIRNDPKAPAHLAVTGHCANTAALGDVEVLELVEPLGNDRWRHHAMFVLHNSSGQLGEMKGRKNQKPSPRLWKYILELLRQRKEIKGLYGAGHKPENNFHLKDFPKQYLDILRRERPELFTSSASDQLPR